MKHIRAGKVRPQDALKALEADQSYYSTPCRDLPLVSVNPPLSYAAKAWLGMTVNHGVKNQMDGERKKVVKDFVSDVHGVGWSAYTLDRAIVAWRRLGNEFMPTQGQLNNARTEAKQESALKVYDELRKDILKLSGATPKPKELPSQDKNNLEDRKAHLAKLKADEARGYAIKGDGKKRPWIGHIDGLMMKNIEEGIARMESAQ